MPNNIQNNFQYGRISNRDMARKDVGIYERGLKEAVDVLVSKEGGVVRRPGFAVAYEFSAALAGARLEEFIGLNGKSYTLVFSSGLVYLYDGESMVQSADGSLFSITAPWDFTDIDNIRVTRISISHNRYASAGLYTAHLTHAVITCAGYYPYELRIPSAAAGAYEYELKRFDFLAYETETPGSSIQTYDSGTVVGVNFLTGYPDSIVLSDTYEGQWFVFAAYDGTSSADIWFFKVVTYDAGNTRMESAAYTSLQSEVLFSMTDADPDVDFITGRNIYYIGAVFMDPNKVKPVAAVALQSRLWFLSMEDYPGRMLGGRPNDPYNPSNTMYNFFADPDDGNGAIMWEILEVEGSPAVWGVSTERGILFGTEKGPYLVHNNGSAFTNSTIPQIVHMADNSCENVPPVFINDMLVFVQKPGNALSALRFDEARDQYIAPDFMTHSRDLASPKIKQIKFQQNPIPILWVVKTDGTCAAHTYFPQAGVLGWTEITLRDNIISVVPHRDASGEEFLVLLAEEDGTYYLHQSGSFNNANAGTSYSNYYDSCKHFDPDNFDIELAAIIRGTGGKYEYRNNTPSIVRSTYLIDRKIADLAYMSDKNFIGDTQIDSVSINSEFFELVPGFTTREYLLFDPDGFVPADWHTPGSNLVLWRDMEPDSSSEIQSLDLGTVHSEVQEQRTWKGVTAASRSSSLGRPYLRFGGLRTMYNDDTIHAIIKPPSNVANEFSMSCLRIRFDQESLDSLFVTGNSLICSTYQASAADRDTGGFYLTLYRPSTDVYQLRMRIYHVASYDDTYTIPAAYLTDGLWHNIYIVSHTLIGTTSWQIFVTMDELRYGSGFSSAMLEHSDISATTLSWSGEWTFGADGVSSTDGTEGAVFDLMQISTVEEYSFVAQAVAGPAAIYDLSLALSSGFKCLGEGIGIYRSKMGGDVIGGTGYYLTDFEYLDSGDTDLDDIYGSAITIAAYAGGLSNATVDSVPTDSRMRGRLLLQESVRSYLEITTTFWAHERDRAYGAPISYVLQVYFDATGLSADRDYLLVDYRDNADAAACGLSIHFDNASSTFWFLYTLVFHNTGGGTEAINLKSQPIALATTQKLFTVVFGNITYESASTNEQAEAWLMVKGLSNEFWQSIGTDATMDVYDAAETAIQGLFLGGLQGAFPTNDIEINHFAVFDRRIDYHELCRCDEGLFNWQTQASVQVDADEEIYEESSVSVTALEALATINQSAIVALTDMSPQSVNQAIYTMRGLGEFAGETIFGLNEGTLITPTVAADGSITFSAPTTLVFVGQTYDSYIVLLPFTLSEGKRIQVTEVIALFSNSLGVRVGDALDGDQMSWDDYIVLDVPTTPQDGYYRIKFPGGHRRNGEVYIHQDQPYHMNILEVITRFELGEE
jgi:hypothetical protein